MYFAIFEDENTPRILKHKKEYKEVKIDVLLTLSCIFENAAYLSLFLFFSLLSPPILSFTWAIATTRRRVNHVRPLDVDFLESSGSPVNCAVVLLLRWSVAIRDEDLCRSTRAQISPVGGIMIHLLRFLLH